MSFEASVVPVREEPRKAAPEPELLTFPCTPPQERCWFLEKLSPGNSALNVAVRWEIHGEIAMASIESAFRSVIARHEILRTRLIEQNGAPLQHVLEHIDFALRVVDLQQLPEPERPARAAELCALEAKAPFELGRAPLIRATALRTARDRTLLLVVVHQCAFDGWSIRVLGREIGAALDAVESGHALAWGDLPLQYGDYALWYRECLNATGFESERDYWLEQLAGAPYFEIATDRPRGLRRTPNGELLGTLLQREASDRLEAVAKAHGVSVFNLGCAVVAAVLHRMSGETDVVFGTQVAGRDETDLEALIGVFINNLVLRIDTAGDPSFSELVARSERVVHGALAHQKLPFHKLVELRNPPRDLARTPLISINVIVQRAFLENTRYERFELRGVPSPSPGAFYDLNFQMIGRPEGWRMSVEYNTDLFLRETAQDLLDGWKAALEAAVADPTLRVSALPAPRARRKRTPRSGPHAALEELLSRQADVADAAVVELDDGGAPYAYVEPAPDTRAPLESLPRTLLAAAGGQQLRGVSVLLRLPRDASGRVDRAALPMPAAAPRIDAPALEARIAEIWRDVLGAPSVAPADSFFDLGGHSMLAVRMLIRVEAELGARVDIATLFGAPQLRAFAQALAALGVVAHAAPVPPASDAWKIVQLRDSGERAPIVGINNLGVVAALAQQLPDHPALCVRTFDPSQGAQHFEPRPFAAIAAEYVALIRRARPHGPYILIGLCVHGVLAIEIAQQLRAAGEEVALVAALNCWEPGYVADLSKARRWLLRFHDVGKHLVKLATAQTTPLAFLGTYRLAHESGALQLLQSLRVIDAIPPRTGSSDSDEFLLYLHHSRDDYRPLPFAGEVLLFRDETTPQLPWFDAALGWSRVLRGRHEVVWVPRMNVAAPNDPGVLAVVRQLKAALERRQGAPG